MTKADDLLIERVAAVLRHGLRAVPSELDMDEVNAVADVVVDAVEAEIRRQQSGRSFDDLFEDHKLTPDERTKLVWHLAAFRARRTVETLLPSLDVDIRDYGAKSRIPRR